LRGIWIVVACVSWELPVLAAPMVVAEPEVDVRSEPSETASVTRRLSAGFVVCPLPRGETTTPPADISTAQGDAGTGDAPAPQWIAIRLGAETGYLPATFVRSTNSESAAAICDPALALRSAVKSQPADREGLPGAVRRPAPSSTSRFLPVDPFRLTLGFAVGSATLRQDAADEHHIGRSGGSVYVIMGLVLGDLFSVSTSLGAVIPPDGATFEQDVVPLLGPQKPMTATSSLEITNVSFAAGPRTPLLVVARRSEGAWVSALFAEYGWALITGNHFIADCRDCRQEGLGLPNGALFRVGADFGYVWFRQLGHVGDVQRLLSALLSPFWSHPGDSRRHRDLAVLGVDAQPDRRLPGAHQRAGRAADGDDHAVRRRN